MNRVSASLLLLLASAGPASAASPPAADREVVRVNGTPIRQSEVMERLWKRHGPQTLEDMVDELLLRQAAKQRGIEADDKEVARRLRKLQAQFGSRELFISQLEQAGSSLTKVKEDLAEDLTRERLVVTAKNLKVDDAELKQAFDQHKDKLGEPEAVHLRHILAADEKQAAELLAKVKAGGDFKALAREKSLAASGKASGGDYGFVKKGMLPPEIEEVAFAMAPGELKVVSGGRGRHILQVLDKRASKTAVYADVKDDLRELLLADKIKRAAPEFLQELRAKADIRTPGAPAKNTSR